MGRYFRWQMTVPDEKFLPPFWQQQRAADNLDSVYWLYNRTGEAWLLDLAEKIHRNTANWSGDVASWHNVNIAQAFGGPATYYMQSKDPEHLFAAERNYREVRELYGRVPGGMFGGDENCRPGYAGPRQAIETCGVVEQMLSDETLSADHGRPDLGRSLRAGRFQLAPGHDHPRPEGPTVSDRAEHGVERSAQQIARASERRADALDEPAHSPLLPAQHGPRMALLCTEPLVGHARQRPGGRHVRAL